MPVRRETRNLVASEEIPHNGGEASIVAECEPASSSLADVVRGDQKDVFLVLLERALDCQSVMVEAEDDIALSVDEEGCCCCTWIECSLYIVWAGDGLSYMRTV